MASPRNLPPSRTLQGGRQPMPTPPTLRASSPHPPPIQLGMQSLYSTRALTPTPATYSPWVLEHSRVPQHPEQHQAQYMTFNRVPSVDDQMDLDPAFSIPALYAHGSRLSQHPLRPSPVDQLEQDISATSSSTSSDKSTKRSEQLANAKAQLENLKVNLNYWCKFVQGRWSEQCNSFLPFPERYEDFSQANGIATLWEGVVNAPEFSPTKGVEKMKEKRILSRQQEFFESTDNAIGAFIRGWELIQGLQAPTPSEFGDVRCWEEHQAKNPILCLRPPTAIGLPVTLLHDGFRKYESNIFNSDFEGSPAARKAAEVLCKRMGERFTSEAHRSRAIDSALKPLWPALHREFSLKPHKDYASGRADRACPIGFLCEHKLECCSGKSDGHMQLCRCYQLYVEAVKKGQIQIDSAEAYINAGCPTFLLLIQGALIHVYGGFFDGKACIVEPLGDPLTMLRDQRGLREQRLCKILTALKLGHDDILDLVRNPPTQPYEYPAGTPRIYRTCTLYSSEQETQAELQFLRPLVDAATPAIHHFIFRATMRCNGDNTEVVVKIPRTYSTDVHHHLFHKGLAPKLLAYCKHPDRSIPIAYVIELLPASWTTLQSLAVAQPSLFTRYRKEIRDALDNVITHLETSGFVHGDLRANNVMIDADTLNGDGKVSLKLVDFDWSGAAGIALYPGSRNEDLNFPGEAGGPIEQNDDSKLMNGWWHKLVAQARASLL